MINNVFGLYYLGNVQVKLVTVYTLYSTYKGKGFYSLYRVSLQRKAFFSISFLAPLQLTTHVYMFCIALDSTPQEEKCTRTSHQKVGEYKFIWITVNIKNESYQRSG